VGTAAESATRQMAIPSSVAAGFEIGVGIGLGTGTGGKI
jgi:hypothetical protein